MLLYRTVSGWWVQTAPGVGVPLPSATNRLTTREAGRVVFNGLPTDVEVCVSTELQALSK